MVTTKEQAIEIWTHIHVLEGTTFDQLEDALDVVFTERQRKNLTRYLGMLRRRVMYKMTQLDTGELA